MKMDFSLKLKKGLASIASVAVALTTMVVAPSAQANWYESYVSALESAGVIDSDFDATADTTRHGFVKALVKAAGLSESDNDAGFADVNDGYVNAAVEAGIIDGPKAEKDNNFFPNNNINRAEVTKVVLEALGIDVAEYSSPSAPHGDVDASAWFADYVAAAYNLSIVDGVGGSTEEFNPAGNIVNAAMSKIVSYGVIVAEDAESFVRFDDGESAFSVFTAEEVEEQVVSIVDVEEATEEEVAEEQTTEEEASEETEEEETVVISDGSLEVSLSADSPAATDIPGTVQGVQYLAVDFTANGDDVEVSSVTVTRTGLGSRSDFDKVWLEIDGKRVTSKKTINSDEESVLTVLGGGFEVEAGETVTVDVVASMETTTSGQINVLSIVSADAVTSNGEAVVGDFPIQGAQMQTTSYTVTTLRVEQQGSAETVDVNDTDTTVGEFDIAVSSDSDKDAMLREIVLENEGTSEVEGNLENLGLYQSGTLVSEEVTVEGDVVSFFLGEEGYLIEDGDTKRFEIKADIVDGEEGDTFIFQVKEREDVVAIETNTGFATTNYEGTGFTTSLEDYNATATYTINAGKLTLSLDADSPSNQDVARDASSVEFLLGEIKVDQAIRVDGLKVYLHADSSFNEELDADDGDNDGVDNDTMTSYDIDQTLENVKLYVGGDLIDSVDSVTGTATVAGAGFQSPANNTSFYYDFDSTFDITETTSFRVVADIRDEDNLSGTDIKFTVSADDFDSPEYISTGDAVVDADSTGSATSNLTTIIASEATVTRNDGYSDGETFVAGAKDLLLGKFVIEAGSASGLDIRKLLFNFARDANNDGTVDGVLNRDNFANIKLMVGDEQLGDTGDLEEVTIDTNSSGKITFDGFSYAIAKSGQATFSVYGELESNADAITDLHVYLNAADSTIEDDQDDTVTPTNNFDITNVAALTVSEGGTLTVTTDGDTPNTQLLVANSTDLEIAKFKIQATDEDIEITDLYFMNDYDADNAAEDDADARFSAVKLYIGSELIDSRTPTSGAFQFELGNDNKITVPKDDDVVITIKGDLNNITDADQTNKQMLVSFYAVKANSSGTGTAIDSADVTGISGSDATETLTVNVDGDVQYITKTRPTLTTQTLSTSKLVSGEQTLYEVSIAADSNEDVEVGAITFNVAGTIATNTIDVADTANSELDAGATTGALSGFKLYVNDDEIDSSDYTLTVSEVGSTDNFAINFAFTDGNDETISEGSSKVFELKATAASVQSDDYVSVKIVEDSAVKTADSVTLVKGAAANAGTTSWEAADVVTITVNGNSVTYTVVAGDVDADDTDLMTSIKGAMDGDATIAALVDVAVTDNNTLTLTADSANTVITASASITTDNSGNGVDTITATLDTTNNLVWSDNAGSPHTRSTTDWFNGFEVNGLDTSTTTLQN